MSKVRWTRDADGAYTALIGERWFAIDRVGRGWLVRVDGVRRYAASKLASAKRYAEDVLATEDVTHARDDAPAVRDGIVVDLGSVSEEDARRMAAALESESRGCGTENHAETRALQTLALYVEMRLNLASRAAHRNDPVVVER